MEIEIINYPKNYIDILYLAGRNCYGLEIVTKDTSMEDKKIFIKKMIKNYHESILEHCSISIYIKGCSRSFMSQITRHRLCSFSVKSQHFVKHRNFLYKDLETDMMKKEYEKLMISTAKFYNNALDIGIPRHIAREVLPNSCLTNIFMTANIREWRHILKLRATSNNTIEIKNFAIELIKSFNKKMPECFDDLEAEYVRLH